MMIPEEVILAFKMAVNEFIPLGYQLNNNIIKMYNVLTPILMGIEYDTINPNRDDFFGIIALEEACEKYLNSPSNLIGASPLLNQHQDRCQKCQNP